MINALGNFIKNSSFIGNASMCVCSVASLEMGCRTIANLTSLISENEGESKESILKDLSSNLSGSLLFGLCATNLFPGIRKVGALAFTVRSFFVFFAWPELYDRNEEYLTGRAITFFPDQSYQSYKWIKSKINIPFHPSWILLIGVISLVGYYQFGERIHSYFKNIKAEPAS